MFGSLPRMVLKNISEETLSRPRTITFLPRATKPSSPLTNEGALSKPLFRAAMGAFYKVRIEAQAASCAECIAARPKLHVVRSHGLVPLLFSILDLVPHVLEHLSGVHCIQEYCQLITRYPPEDNDKEQVYHDPSKSIEHKKI